MTTLSIGTELSYRFDVRQFHRMMAAGIFGDQMIVRLRGPDTLIEVWTGPAGRRAGARYTDVIRYTARAGESVPIELDGSTYGQVAVVELVALGRKTED